MDKLVIGLIFLAMPLCTFAATYIIEADGTGDYPTIQAAIDAAEPNDIVILESGRVAEHGERGALAGDPGSRFAQLLETGLREVLA